MSGYVRFCLFSRRPALGCKETALARGGPVPFVSSSDLEPSPGIAYVLLPGGEVYAAVGYEGDGFCLFPADESVGMIQFEPEDVTLLCYQASIGDQFYVEEFLSLDWYDGYLYAS